MPIKFEMDYSKDLAIFTLTGEVTFKNTIEVLDAYLKAGLVRFDIVDASRGSVKKFTFKQMDKIIEWAEKNSVARPPDCKTVFVVPGDADPETSGLFQVLAQFNRANWPAKVVHSLLEAYEWLDMPSQELKISPGVKGRKR